MVLPKILCNLLAQLLSEVWEITVEFHCDKSCFSRWDTVLSGLKKIIFLPDLGQSHYKDRIQNFEIIFLFLFFCPEVYLVFGSWLK